MFVRSLRDIAVAVRGRRQELGISQTDLAKQVGVSRKWINEFEAGKSTAELGLVLRVLEELGFQLELHRKSGTGQESGGDAVDLDSLLAELRAPEDR